MKPRSGVDPFFGWGGGGGGQKLEKCQNISERSRAQTIFAPQKLILYTFSGIFMLYVMVL